jgi:hypothetical protein
MTEAAISGSEQNSAFQKQNSVADGQVARGVMECPICRETIRRGALKCVKCGSDLRGVRKFVTLGNSTLALATALIAVFGAFAPVIAKVFAPRDARFHATYISTTHTDEGFDSLLILVSNDGTKSGAVLNGTVNIMWSQGQQHYQVDLAFSKKWGQPTVIDAGKTADITMELAENIVTDTNTDLSAVNALLNLLKQSPSQDPSNPLAIDLDASGSDKEICNISLSVVYNSGMPGTLPSVPANCADFNDGLTNTPSQ